MLKWVWLVITITTSGISFTAYDTNAHGGIQVMLNQAAPISTPTIVPTSVPTPVTTIAPTPVPTFAAGTFWTNGKQIPALFANSNFGASGPLYQLLPVSPVIASYSASAVSYYFANNAGDFNVGLVDSNNQQGQYDYRFPIYVASLADPLVTIVGPCVENGGQIHLPALAKQAGGEDHHLGVIEPNGVEYDFWLVTSVPPYVNGSKLVSQGCGSLYLSGANSGPTFIAPGFGFEMATAGGIALSAGQIYTSELAAGVINHAIAYNLPCESIGWVFPATQQTGTCANGNGVPLGSRIWWSPTDTATNAMNLPRDVKTILIAMHHYGGYFTDNGNGTSNINGQGGGIGTKVESNQPYWVYGGGVDPALNYVKSSPGWNHIIVSSANLDRWILVTTGAQVDFLHNIKFLDPALTHS